MASAATAADVGDLLGAELEGAELTRAERLLVKAEGIIQSYVPGLTFARTPFTALAAQGVDGRTLILPVRPLTEVTVVETPAGVLEAWQYRTTPRGELILTEDACWGDPEDSILVTGVAGPTGQDVAFIAADLVRQTLVNPAGLRMEVIGGRTAQFDQDIRPMTLTSAHRRILNRYRITAQAMSLR